MKAEHHYYVYILASRSRRLYTGVTSDLEKRVWQHRQGTHLGFSKRYRISRLVHYEATSEVYSALTREKQIKAWSRSKKTALIESGNPGWDDLAESWY